MQEYPVVSKEDELIHSEKEHSGWFPGDMSRIVFNIFPVWTKQSSSIRWVAYAIFIQSPTERTLQVLIGQFPRESIFFGSCPAVEKRTKAAALPKCVINASVMKLMTNRTRLLNLQIEYAH